MSKLGVGLVICIALSAHAQWMSQTLTLKTGWNAVYLNVQPAEDGCDEIFGSTSVDRVSWWCKSAEGMSFLQSPLEVLPLSADMLNWYRDDPPASTFYRVVGGECYLVKSLSTCTLTIKGVPALAPKAWLPGMANLVGVHIPGGLSVRLGEYYQFFTGLAVSEPFAIVLTNAATAIPIPTYTPAPDTALWVTTREGEVPDYAGPFNLSLDSSADVIGYAGVLSPRTLSVKNNSDMVRTLRIELLSSESPPAGQGSLAGNVPLLRSVTDWSGGYPRETFVDMVFPFVTNVAAGASFNLKMIPKLSVMPPVEGAYQSILGISDKGTPGEAAVFPNGRCYYTVGVRAEGNLSEQGQPAGLWSGEAVLTGVNRAQMLTSASNTWNAAVVQPASHTFGFRLLLHVDEYGVTRLLKEVFAVTVPQGEPNAGNYLLALYEHAANFRAQNPSAVIRRLSSANFPFMDPLTMTGAGFAVADATLVGTVSQGFDDKTNPFVHAFHPSHDNFEFRNGVQYEQPDGKESWGVAREVRLTFSADDPVGANVEWNRTVTGGTYRERVTNLNKTEMIAEGIFRINKISETSRILYISGP